MTAGLVRAAGGVLFRAEDGPEVLAVHRPRYDDWSLPKGKILDGETEAEAAVREVFEETGYRTRVVSEVGRVRYRDHKGRRKEVAYFVVERQGAGSFRPNDEVDRVRWIPVAEALHELSYARDARIVMRAAS